MTSASTKFFTVKATTSDVFEDYDLKIRGFEGYVHGGIMELFEEWIDYIRNNQPLLITRGPGDYTFEVVWCPDHYDFNMDYIESGWSFSLIHFFPEV